MAGIFFRKYKYLIVILIGVITGSLLANVVITDITGKIGIFDNEFKLSLMNIQLDGMIYLRYVFKQRMKEYIILWLIALTPAALPGIYAFMGFAGISMGVIVSVCVMNMGLKGMLAYAVCILPQYIIYGIAAFFMVSFVEKKHTGMKKTAVIIIISLICVITGILYETYISTWLMENLFKHISYCI